MTQQPKVFHDLQASSSSTCSHFLPFTWHTHTYCNIFSGSLINFTVVCRVPSQEVSLRGCDSIGRPLPHPRLGCLIGPPAASSQMNGTLLTPNLCRPWSVPHLSSTCSTGCWRERREVCVCFLLVIVEVNGSRGMNRLRKQRTECLVSLCARSLFLSSPPASFSYDPILCLSFFVFSRLIPGFTFVMSLHQFLSPADKKKTVERRNK